MNQPKPAFAEQPMESTLGDVLAAFIVAKDWKFFMDDKPVPVSMMTGNRAFLPVVLWHADKVHLQTTGRRIGVMFRADGEASVGAHSSLEHVRRTSTLTLYCLEALVQAIEQHPAVQASVSITPSDLRSNVLAGARTPPKGSGATVDHLVQAFFDDHERGLVPWAPDSQPKSPTLNWAQRH
ncbi:hypothetical protein ACSFA0_23830 [Variovorax sp. LT1P1]|uniref:hypothetical protein n=1 Tax=Variovorax sp. LT1P1 TaxID=3443730 RepID=UPI003F464D1E